MAKSKRSASKSGPGKATEPASPSSPPPQAITKPAPVKSIPPSNTSSGNSSVWFMIFLISIGCGVSFYFFFEEMRAANQVLIVQLDDMKAKVLDLSKSQQTLAAEIATTKSSSDVTEKMTAMQKEVNSLQHAIKSTQSSVSGIGEKIEQDQDSLGHKIEKFESRLEQLGKEMTSQQGKASADFRSLSDTVSKLQAGVSETSLELESFIEVHQVTTKSLPDLAKLMDDIEKLKSRMSDSFAVADTNLEGLAKDISRVQSMFQPYEDKIASMQAEISSFQSSVNKFDANSKQSEVSLRDRLAQFETGSRNFEEDLSEKIKLLEKTLTQQVSDLTVQTVNAKQVAEGVRTSLDEIRSNMKSNIADALSSVKNDLKIVKEISDEVVVKQRQAEMDIAKLNIKSENDNALTNVQAEMTSLNQKVSEAAQNYAKVDGLINQTERKLVSQISTLTEHVRASKNDVASMRNDALVISEAVNQLRNDVQIAKATSDSLGAKINNYKDEMMKAFEREGDIVVNDGEN
ncbi:uncharacterized protein LOC143459060 [Clavelina lepadiformis]|uniref:uncharacterized protein LOC143459060 n=1 Tax=Clavelina lepadiformis TaxID=159417 RepID=UPI004043372F